ncbi:MAG: 50S ribosome-binding GTPase, partial [Candidatus Hydrogenedentes bacterium]|nr:50S ribosome-binding GTPase [Candidatus Hydrogenedentota bacterium]
MEQDRLGDILKEYESHLRGLRREVSAVPAVEALLFRTFEDWERQLTFKLAPRLAGEGCLIVAVAGGTNTGKSTVFNCLLGRSLSPVSPFGAFTKHPLVTAGPSRYEQCLERGKLLPDAFIPTPAGDNLEADITD